LRDSSQKNYDDKFDKLSDCLLKTDDLLNKLIKKTNKELSHLIASQEKTEKQIKQMSNLIASQVASQEKTEKQMSNLIASQVASQEKTEKQMRNLIASQEKTDKELNNLIGYNKNRDNELEIAFLNAFVDFLNKNEWWFVVTLDVAEIYDTQGKVITEWDGVVYATHKNISNPCLFFLETKQLFTTKKLQSFYKRLDKMKKDVLPKLNYKDPDAKQIYKSMAKTLSTYLELSGNITAKVYGVIGSPNIEQGAKERISASTSFVTLTEDVYKVVLQI
jgi:hypothetical protein